MSGLGGVKTKRRRLSKEGGRKEGSWALGDPGATSRNGRLTAGSPVLIRVGEAQIPGTGSSLSTFYTYIGGKQGRGIGLSLP